MPTDLTLQQWAGILFALAVAAVIVAITLYFGEDE